MHLAIVGMIFKKSVLEDKSLNSLRGGHAEGTIAHGLYLLLKAAGVHLKLPHAPANDVNKFYHSVSKHRFAGADASKLLTVWPQVMELVFPEAKRRASKDTQQKYDNHCSVWRFWAQDLWPLIQNVDLDRTIKANQVQARAIQFITLWVNATGGTQNLYLHLLVKHLPEQIRPGTPLSMPCDPWFLQTQSLESKHSFRKSVHLGRTNKHAPKPLAERAQEILNYFRGDGTAVTGYKRSSGKCRGLQALEKSVLHDLLYDHYETPVSKAIKFKRADARRQARHQRLMRSKGLLLTYVTAKGKEISGDFEVEDGVAEQLALSEEENEDRPEGAPASEESEDNPEESQSSSTLSSTDSD
jgi:hypothetical protein